MHWSLDRGIPKYWQDIKGDLQYLDLRIHKWNVGCDYRLILRVSTQAIILSENKFSIYLYLFVGRPIYINGRKMDGNYAVILAIAQTDVSRVQSFSQPPRRVFNLELISGMFCNSCLPWLLLNIKLMDSTMNKQTPPTVYHRTQTHPTSICLLWTVCCWYCVSFLCVIVLKPERKTSEFHMLMLCFMFHREIKKN